MHPSSPPPAPGGRPEFDVRLGRIWREHYRRLLNVAFRVLGSLSEAEDAVQEAFARLVNRQLDEIEDVSRWLTVVVSRLCFDQLRSANWQSRSSMGPPPEPPPAQDMDPADRITLDDEVRLALHVVMAQLTPAERTSFVLHDVFGYTFEAISEVVGRSPAACRQLASRARRTIAADRADRFPVEAAEQHQLAERFIAACSTGDFEGMLAVMDPNCSGEVDTGAAVGEFVDLPGIGRMRQGPPVIGREAVARLAMRYNGPDSSVTLLSLPSFDKPTVIGLSEGRVVIYFTMTVGEGRITHGSVVLDPRKLADMNFILDT